MRVRTHGHLPFVLVGFRHRKHTSHSRSKGTSMNVVDPPMGYPLRIEGVLDANLSRGLWLVKWLLLAIPHYLILAVFLDTGCTVWGGPDGWGFGGLITLMVLIAAVMLLFTARYPKPIYDFVLGMNRWAFRVAAYCLLM